MVFELLTQPHELLPHSAMAPELSKLTVNSSANMLLISGIAATAVLV